MLPVVNIETSPSLILICACVLTNYDLKQMTKLPRSTRLLHRPGLAPHLAEVILAPHKNPPQAEVIVAIHE